MDEANRSSAVRFYRADLAEKIRHDFDLLRELLQEL
jgi:hypothetical protein